MKTNEISNIFLSDNTDLKQKEYFFNECENDINNKYKNYEYQQNENYSLNKEEKYKEYEIKHKKNIFNKNYKKKISLFTQSNQDTLSKTKSKKNIVPNNNNSTNNELSFEQYIEYLKKKFEEDPLQFENMDETNNKYYYRFSFCFFCHHIAFAYKDQISCFNRCCTMQVRTDEFNENYTLSNFLESHYEFYYDHIECNGEIIPIYINKKKKEPYFICDVCDKKILEKLGIDL